MTQHVRKSYRNHRRASWGLALLAAAAVALVMFVAMAGAANDPSDRGVTPTVVDLGGQMNDCSTSQVHSVADWDFRIVNPINGTTYTDSRTGASFQISLDANQILLGFIGTKAAVFDLVVKGGQKSTWYDYDGTGGPGPVTSDSKLHAPPKGNTYFAVSHVSFCYSTKGSISGTVYNDLNSNGALTTPAEPGLSGWTVKAYDSSGTVVATSVPTLASGSYTLSNLPLGSTYAVCATPSSGSWALSEPTTTPSACSSSPSGRGWQFQLDASTTKNFGAQSAVQPDCDDPFSGSAFSGGVQYEAQLVPNNGLCKPGPLVMYSHSPGTNQLFATLHPVSPGGPTHGVVEHIHMTGITRETQNLGTLQYDDIAPFDGADTAIPGNDGWRVMKLCGSDPRPFPSNPPLAAGQSPFDLGGNTPAMPPPDPVDGAHTTCMLQNTDSAGTGTSGRTYDAWLFSLIDGTRNGI